MINELWLIAYVTGKGWCIVDPKGNIHAGPCATHADAVETMETRAFRIAQGWAP